MLLLLLLVWMAVSSGAKVEFSSAGEQTVAANRSCSVDELLPRALPSNSSISPEWSQEEVVELPYGCDCSFFKARYFCQHDDKKAHRKWEPQAESEGICKSVGLSDLSEAPFPPKFKVLFYGNSHLRQVVQAILCQFPRAVLFKRVKYTGGGIKGVRTIDGEVACRACRTAEDEAAVVDHDCIPETDVVSEACSCDDDRGEFFMANGAILHFYFAHTENNKSIERALRSHDNVPLSYYDAVFANAGNSPHLSEESILATAFELQNYSAPFFYLSKYGGTEGFVTEWEEHNRVLFRESGARYVDISAMAHGLTSLTRGAVEHKHGVDSHYCLPGPPDQMGLLLLKIMWAVHQEKFYPAR